MELKNSLPICDRCGKYLENGGDICSDCATMPASFFISRAVGPYEESYRIAIKVFKFLCRKYLGVKMGKMMAEVVKAEPRFSPIDIIVPVPISQKNLRERGFNQTEILAAQIGRELRIKTDPYILQRVKETPPQRELSREERQINLLYAFQVQQPGKILNKNILLVDDVFTTGSTSRECARVLLQAGVDKVYVITWATGKGF
jgi:ComF family protein